MTSGLLVMDGPGNRSALPELLEGFFYGLGDVCHQLFGAEGEGAIYRAVGKRFIEYLRNVKGQPLDFEDPWRCFCELTQLFTASGFYQHVELRELEDEQYWMLETDQYAGNIWEIQNSWERGSAPCPLWALLTASLAELGYCIVLDDVSYRGDCGGFESRFHFEADACDLSPSLQQLKRQVINAMIRFCSHCKRVRTEDGEWIPVDQYLRREHDAEISHVVCPDCFAQNTAEPRPSVAVL